MSEGESMIPETDRNFSSKDAPVNKEEEKTRIYDNVADDPMIDEIVAKSVRIAKRTVDRSRDGKLSETDAKEVKGLEYGAAFEKKLDQLGQEFWDRFLVDYPEKAAAYRDKYPPIKEAFERTEGQHFSPEDKQGSIDDENKKIYDNPADDPMVEQTASRIFRISTRTLDRAKDGKLGDADAKEVKDLGQGVAWMKKNEQLGQELWDDFLKKYPEKAAAYRDQYPPIKDALERQGQQRSREQ